MGSCVHSTMVHHRHQWPVNLHKISTLCDIIHVPYNPKGTGTE